MKMGILKLRILTLHTNLKSPVNDHLLAKLMTIYYTNGNIKTGKIRSTVGLPSTTKEIHGTPENLLCKK